MSNTESTQKKELLIMTLGFAMPLLVLTMIYFAEEYPQAPTNIEPAKADEFIFDVENLEATSAMVTEIKTGKILFELNKEEQKPIASITKLMTSLVADKRLARIGAKEIEIAENHLTAFGDSGLLVGQVWKVGDLIDFTLITSSNDGAKALALSAFDNNENSFISEMNSFARDLGLGNTRFLNETGLDINLDTQAGAISTAEDITKILKVISKNKLDIFEGTTEGVKTITTGEDIYQAENTNSLVNKLPGVLLSKTGYTDVAGGNIAMMIDFGLNNPVSIVILGSTQEERENDIERLYKETSKYYLNELK